MAAILSQKHHDGMLKSVVFISKKMFLAEYNYEIYNKELLAIIQVFEKWYPKLIRTLIEHPIYVITDHENSKYFRSTKDLNKRQT